MACLRDLDIDGRMMLEWLLKNTVMRVCSAFERFSVEGNGHGDD
jgi:hypothetical protein